MKKRVCILACVFSPIYPGFGGRHAYVLAENLLKAGYEVDVVTTFPINLQRGGFFRQTILSKEDLNGIRVFRVFSLLPTGLGIWRKFLLYTSFMLASLIALPFVKRADVVLGLDPPAPFLILPGFIFSRLLRAKYILRVTDLWPDVVFDFSLVRLKLLKSIVTFISTCAYRLADHIMAFTPQIKENIMKYGVSEEKISMVEMAVDTSIFRPMPEVAEEATALEFMNPKDKFVVLYSGAFALTYDFDTLLEAAKMLDGEAILFVLLGDGDAKEQILGKTEELGLKNVTFPSPVSGPEMVAKYINFSEVCVIPLKPNMVTSMLTRPSKVFEFWSCEKPVIVCSKGELPALIEESQAGITLEPGNPQALADAIRFLYLNRDLTANMGKKGREFVLGRFSYDTLGTKLRTMLDQLVSKGRE